MSDNLSAPDRPSKASRRPGFGLSGDKILLAAAAALAVLILAFVFAPLRSAVVADQPLIAYVDVPAVERPYLNLITTTPQMNGQALGVALGMAIHRVSDELSQRGYIVLGGDNVLAAAPRYDLTSVVRDNVAAILTAQNPSWAVPPGNTAGQEAGGIPAPPAPPAAAPTALPALPGNPSGQGAAQ